MYRYLPKIIWWSTSLSWAQVSNFRYDLLLRRYLHNQPMCLIWPALYIGSLMRLWSTVEQSLSLFNFAMLENFFTLWCAILKSSKQKNTNFLFKFSLQKLVNICVSCILIFSFWYPVFTIFIPLDIICDKSVPNKDNFKCGKTRLKVLLLSLLFMMLLLLLLLLLLFLFLLLIPETYL